MTFDKVRLISNKENSRGFGGKIYLHHSGKKECSSGNELKKYMIESFHIAPSGIKDFDYFNAILWANEENMKIVDFFGYLGVGEKWKSNPDIESWTIRNGVWRYQNKITCGEGSILFGEEEKLRRRTKNIDDYLSKSVDLHKLNRMLKFSK